jgi:F0F1-type ATP synthase delta subunit
MKYDRAYAHALTVALEQAPTTEAAQARWQSFQALLRRRGHEKLLPRILSEYQRLVSKRQRRQRVWMRINEEADKDAAMNVANEYLTPQQRDRLQTRVDATLIGGFQLETHDTLVDNSYKRMLLQLYRRLIT